MRKEVEEWLLKNHISVKKLLKIGKDRHQIDERHIKAAIDHVFDYERTMIRRSRIAWRIWEIAQHEETYLNVQTWIKHYDEERQKLADYDSMKLKCDSINEIWSNRVIVGAFVIFGTLTFLLAMYARPSIGLVNAGY